MQSKFRLEVEGSSEEQAVNEASVLCTNATLRTNMLILVTIWMTVSFSYFLINFQLKYLGGNIYVNAITTSLAEMVGKLSSSPVL